MWSFPACVRLHYILQGHWGSLFWIRFWYVVSPNWRYELFLEPRGAHPQMLDLLNPFVYPCQDISTFDPDSYLSSIVAKRKTSTRKGCCKKKACSRYFSLPLFILIKQLSVYGDVYFQTSTIQVTVNRRKFQNERKSTRDRG